MPSRTIHTSAAPDGEQDSLNEGQLKVTSEINSSFYVPLGSVETQLYYDGGPAGSFRFLRESSESGGGANYVLECCGRVGEPKSLLELQKDGYSWYNRNVTVEVRENLVSADSCFVATSAFEDTNNPNVQKLRDYRDKVMKHTPLGRAAIYVYYELGFGAKAANVLDKIPGAKPTVRASLEYLVENIINHKLQARAAMKQNYVAQFSL